MKVRAYIRVAKMANGKAKVDASRSPHDRPLSSSNGEALPTVAFAIDLVVPDGLFTRAEQVIATLTIPEEQARILADVVEHTSPDEVAP